MMEDYFVRKARGSSFLFRFLVGGVGMNSVRH